jgi:transposase-like protein
MGKKAKNYSADIKARVALEALRGQKTIAQIAGEYQVHPTQINQWKKQAMETLRAGFVSKKDQGACVLDSRETDKLYRQIGKLQVENDFLKQAVYPGTAS